VAENKIDCGIGYSGIEAANIIRKGQALGIPRHNLQGQAWVFGALLGVA
jgi:hypothetical protein